MSLAEAPNLDGKSPQESHAISSSFGAQALAEELKRESAKEHLARMFLLATAATQTAFQDLDSDARAAASQVFGVMPGRGPKEKAMAAKQVNDFAAREGDAVLSSLDIKAWSPSQRRHLWNALHCSAGECAGQPAERWKECIRHTHYVYQEGKFRQISETNQIRAAQRS